MLGLQKLSESVRDYAYLILTSQTSTRGPIVYMLPSDMNLRIGKIRNYNNKILISSPSFKIGTNVKVNINVKSKEVEMVKTEPNIEPNKEHKQDVKPNIKFDRESNQDVKEPDTNEITYEEERLL